MRIVAGGRRGWWKPIVGVTALGSMIVAGGCVGPPPPSNPVMITPGDPGTSDVTFDITSNLNTHPISKYIYGTNGATNIGTNKQTLVRQGGNRWTAYNWENNASNAGSDWCFENDGYLSSSNTPGDAVKPTIDLATANGAAALVTVPIVDYVAADKNSPGGCDDVRNSGSNYLSTRFEQNHAVKGSAFSLNPPQADDNVYQDEYVNWLKTNESNANLMFDLDNEPDLWADTHAEVHPAKVRYDELVNRNVTYAKAIKSVLPNAPVAGPVNYGFYGFETLQDAPDASSHGNFLDWWLDQMKAADLAYGKRVVDVMDLHWYPEATGGGTRITVADGGATVAAARVQAPRSLWDPNYVETSWISQDYGYGAIKLIPRMRDRIAAHDPGIGLGFTEWNYGGGDIISGGVASADVLGIFGRENVTLASMWPLNGNESYTYAAFRAFRNFDGAGAAFGDISISAVCSDNATASVYAAVDSSNPNRTVIIAINKSTSAKKAGIKVAHTQAYTKGKVYTLTAGGGANLVAQPDISTVATNAYNYTMPAMSVSVIVPQP